MVRAKFYCHGVEDVSERYNAPAKIVRFSAVYANGEANKEWSKATPCGNLEMTITNPGAFEQFKAGREYFLDIKEAE